MIKIKNNQNGLTHVAILGIMSFIIMGSIVAAYVRVNKSQQNQHNQHSVTLKSSDQAALKSTKESPATNASPSNNSSNTSSPSKTSTTPAKPKTTATPKSYALSYLLNDGAPTDNIPVGKSTFTMPCYKGAGTSDNGSYTITAKTAGGNVQVTMCWYQSFSTTIIGNAARLYLADSQYIDVPLKGGGDAYQASCSGAPATGPIVPVYINNSGNAATVNVQICSSYKFATTSVY